MLTKRLSKTGIEYGNLAWNFYSGCENGKDICAVTQDCWAHGIVNRFPSHYPNGWKPTIYPEALLSPLGIKKPSVILCAFMGDLFGNWVDPDKQIVLPPTLMNQHWVDTVRLSNYVFRVVEQCPQHTFLFLTKNPQGYQKWGRFPENAWCGITVTDERTFAYNMTHLIGVNAKNKWVSIEPLLGRIDPILLGNVLPAIDWLVIGAQSGRHPIQPRIEWVREIVEAADQAGISVWLKDNLIPIFQASEVKEHIYFPPWATANGTYRQQRPF